MNGQLLKATILGGVFVALIFFAVIYLFRVGGNPFQKKQKPQPLSTTGMLEEKTSPERVKVFFKKEPSTQIPFSPVEVTELFKTNLVEAGFYVLTEKSWSETFSDKTDSVELDKYLYLGVSLGERPTGGFSVSITDVNQQENEVFVTTKIREPSPSEFVIQIITNPYQFVRIDKMALKETGTLSFFFVDEELNQLEMVAALVDLSRDSLD